MNLFIHQSSHQKYGQDCINTPHMILYIKNKIEIIYKYKMLLPDHADCYNFQFLNQLEVILD